MSTLTEVDVGLTEYLSPCEGLCGILKLRFEDFVVNEISQSKEEVHLTDVNIIPQELTNNDNEICSETETAISSENQSQLQMLNDSDPNASDTVILKACADKDKRTVIHDVIRKLFPNLESTTVDDKETGEKLIKVTKATTGTLRGQRRRSRNIPKSKYWKLVLYKENIGTMDAISLLCKKLHLKNTKTFHYAGTKDKRGITVQEVTTSLEPEKLGNVNKTMRNIRIGNISPATKALRLGDLSGNHFSIVLRDVKKLKDGEVQAAMQSFSNTGFVNYFGMQRFGTSSVPTYDIGRALLASNWTAAVNLILSSVDAVKGSNEKIKNLLSSWQEEGNVTEALKNLRNDSTCVGQLLHGLRKYGTKQLVQALDNMSRNTRMLYVHSYQSYVWNRIVSRRVKEFGTAPIVGDLVLDDSETDIQDLRKNADNFEFAEPVIKKARTRDDGSKPQTDVTEKRGAKTVKLLTQDNISSYSVTDVVMPLPGHDVSYPAYAESWYKHLFEEDGVSMDDLNHRVKTYSLSGAYRKIISHPKGLTWKLLRYNDYRVSLINSDMDKMNGQPDPEGTEDGQFYALRLEFDLETSSYATVALREVMKSDTTQSYQTKLANEHEKLVDSLLKASTT